ncbi:hypothetical protein L1987_22384 [Smallanthus sonchifolius]|uniref:Uncharacterized protein n=1 Tax=Smallanthus sonchifolius TaxID=185202 RepID=A0ACB9IF96_9ASTR|nr:hypothetical protein L1987_22384 [Smallanthus sonchifolius]
MRAKDKRSQISNTIIPLFPHMLNPNIPVVLPDSPTPSVSEASSSSGSVLHLHLVYVQILIIMLNFMMEESKESPVLDESPAVVDISSMSRTGLLSYVLLQYNLISDIQEEYTKFKALLYSTLSHSIHGSTSFVAATKRRRNLNLLKTLKALNI